MARTYARVKTAIWSDDEFRGLPRDAQHLYFVLMTSATLSFCGVADWRPMRIAAGAGDWDAWEVIEAGLILHDQLYIVVDEDTEEVLLRSFIRNDGLMEQPNVAAAMVRDYAQIASPSIRGVVVHELQRLFEESPGLLGWRDKKGKERASLLLGNPSVNPSTNPSGWPSGNPFENLPGTVTRTLQVTHAPLLTPTPTPTPSSISPSVPRLSRRRHVPDDWQPNDHHQEIATQLELDLVAQVQDFRDYDKSKGPAWKDFDAAFNRWLRNNAKWGKSNRNPHSKQHETDDLFGAAMDRARATQVPYDYREVAP